MAERRLRDHGRQRQRQEHAAPDLRQRQRRGARPPDKAALVRARACNLASKLQCQMTAATGLGCAGCKVWVTSTVELADLRAKWTDAGCGKCKILCPQIACRALTTGVCHS